MKIAFKDNKILTLGGKTFSLVTGVGPMYKINVSQVSNGTISADRSIASVGDLVTLSSVPSSEYRLQYYTVDGSQIQGSSFTMPQRSVTVSGSFEIYIFNVNITQPTGGTVTSNKSKAEAGETVTLSNTASSGYDFQYYTVNGSQIQGNTFTMPSTDVTVSAYYKVEERYTFYTNNTESKVLYTSRISTDVPEGKTVKSYVLEMELNNNPTQLYLTTDGETYQIIGTRGDSYGHRGTWDVLMLRDYNYTSLNPTITYMNTSLVKNNDIRYYYSSHVGYTWCYTVTGINALWTDGWHKLKIVLSSNDFSTSATISIYRDDVLLLTADLLQNLPFDRIGLSGSGNTNKIRNVNYYAVVE